MSYRNPLSACRVRQSRKVNHEHVEAPWRLDVNVNGAAHSYVLQLDARGIGYEYAVL